MASGRPPVQFEWSLPNAQEVVLRRNCMALQEDEGRSKKITALTGKELFDNFFLGLVKSISMSKVFIT